MSITIPERPTKAATDQTIADQMRADARLSRKPGPFAVLWHGLDFCDVLGYADEFMAADRAALFLDWKALRHETFSAVPAALIPAGAWKP